MQSGEVTELSDGELVARYATGRDPDAQDAFAELLRRHGPMVKAVATRILVNDHDAEDAFQATFMALAKSAERVQQPEAIAGWLHQTAVRAALAVRKEKQIWRDRLERKAEQMKSTAPAEDHGRLKKTIDKELEKLPAKYRTAVVLCDLEGLTREKAASRLGIPVRTVSSQVEKGRQLLQARLVKRGIAVTASGLAALMARFADALVPLSGIQISQTTGTAAGFAAAKGAAEIGVSEVVFKSASTVTSGASNMKKAIVVSLLVGALILAGFTMGESPRSQAIGGTLVTPSQYENSEAPGGSGFWSPSSRGMAIFDASEFAAIPAGGANITGYSLRPDGSAEVGDGLEYGHLRISMSLTQRAPSNISATFDSNVEGPQFMVYDGPWSGQVVSEDPPGSATRDFDYDYEFQNPYFYDPADGNLLIEWKFESPGVQTGSFDATEGVTNSGQVHIFSHQGADAATAEVVGFNVVYQFDFAAVPEPSTAAVAIVSLLAVAGILAVRQFRRIWV